MRLFTLVLCICALGILCRVQLTQAQAAERDALQRQLDEIRKKVQEQRDQQSEGIKRRLGERYDTLMSFTIEELKIGFENKVRETLGGSVVLSAEDEPKFLGTITDDIDPDSIFNDIGRYGSNISPTSIWNDIGRYGGEISQFSPFNSITTKAPYIVKDKKVIGRLSTSRFLPGAISPEQIKPCFEF